MPRKLTTFVVDLSQHLAETNKMVPPLLVKCITEIDNRSIQIKVCLKRNTFDKFDSISKGFHSLFVDCRVCIECRASVLPAVEELIQLQFLTVSFPLIEPVNTNFICFSHLAVCGFDSLVFPFSRCTRRGQNCSFSRLLGYLDSIVSNNVLGKFSFNYFTSCLAIPCN